MDSVLAEFYESGVDHVILMPLFPQYASASAGLLNPLYFLSPTSWESTVLPYALHIFPIYLPLVIGALQFRTLNFTLPLLVLRRPINPPP
jgi:hypothetical protein